jgi:hypothetical protein
MLDGLPDAWLLANEGPDTFSPRDVIGHLIHGEETDWVPRAPDHPRARRIRALQALRPLRVPDRVRRPIRRARCSKGSRPCARESLRAVGAMRLDTAALARTGTHPASGA